MVTKKKVKKKTRSVKGDPKMDKEFAEAMDYFERSTRPLKLRNQSQAALRDAARTVRRSLAEIEYVLDIRNEQGRGGLKK